MTKHQLLRFDALARRVALVVVLGAMLAWVVVIVETAVIFARARGYGQ